ncbi:hypothetical protein ACX0G9_00285 [Flavitalea flava]
MHYRKILWMAVLALQVCSHLTAQTDSSILANKLIGIEQSLVDALPGGQTVLWEKYLDDRCYLITEDGTGYHKKDFLATFRPFPKGFSGHIKIIKPVITFYEKTAIIHYVADEYEQIFGQNLHTTYGVANTYHLMDTTWKMIGSQIFEIPQLPRAIKLSARSLEKYTGSYQLSGNDTCFIGVKNDTLFIRKRNKKPENLFPETETVFFRESDTRGRKIFVKDGQGIMEMLERRNGNDLVWKRITSAR